MKNVKVLDNEQFKSAAESVMQYLAENHHPHTKVIIDSDSAELVEGLATHRTEKFIKD